MVNLHVRLPFNLHNRTNSSLSARLDPSSSRSISDSLLALPTPTSPRYPISYVITQQQCHCTPSPGFVDERTSSASRSSSRFDPQHDRSDHDGDADGDGRLPILNLRLVNPGPTFGVGTSNRLSLNRGRSPLKYATTLEVQDTSKNGEPSTILSPPSLPPPIPKSDITGLPTQNQEMDRQDMRSPLNTIGPSMPKTSVWCPNRFPLHLSDLSFSDWHTTARSVYLACVNEQLQNSWK